MIEFLFVANLLVCFIEKPDACFLAQDDRGPYRSIAVCNDRLAEMTVSIMNDPYIGKIHYVRAARCDAIASPNLKTSILSDLKVLGHDTP